MNPVIDLSSAAAPTRMRASVCVIGGGTVGALLARKLGDRGVEVLVVEAGDTRSRNGTELGFDPTVTGARYSGAFEGRAFGLGGSSARWGGVLAPHSDLDLKASPDDEVWRRIVAVVAKRSEGVRALLGIDALDQAAHPRAALGTLADELLRAKLVASAAEMLPFQTRNLKRLLLESGTKNVTVLVNGVATGWEFTTEVGGSRVRCIKAVSRSGQATIIEADEFIVAAGAIESSRILLEVDDATRGETLLGRRTIGRGLGDHLSARIADVIPGDVPLAARLFAPQFKRGVLRMIRLADVDTLSVGVRHFAHFVFPIDNPGFQLAKKVLFGVQAGALPRVSLSELVKGSKGIAALGFDRLVRSRLHVPDDTRVALQLDVEQESSATNGVTLVDERDEYGRRRAQVSWAMTEADRHRVGAAARGVLSKWKELSGVPTLVGIEPNTSEGKLHDAYHPVGLTRMGPDPDAAVDLSLRVRGLTNMSTVSTAVFPSAGTANPTFSALCLAAELADTLRVAVSP